MSVAWFVDGAYMTRVWQHLNRSDRLDYGKLRRYLEDSHLDATKGDTIGDAYFFNADIDPLSARQNSFHLAIQHPPPHGAGLRVKLYPLESRPMNWPYAWGGGPIIHPSSGKQFELSNHRALDVGLTMHLMRSFARRQWQTLILCAGDRDLQEPIQYLVEYENVRLVLVGTAATVSPDLLSCASGFVRLEKAADEVSRPATGTHPRLPPQSGS